MFSEDEYVRVTLYIALLLSVPGPTNTLLICAGYTQGFVKSLRLILAEWLGYLLAVTAWGVFFTYLAQHGNPLLSIIKLLSACYAAYLAVKVWRFSLHQVRGSVTFGTVFITTLLNPKAFLFADSIIPPSAFLYQNNYLHAMFCLLLALLPVSLIWTYAGTLMSFNEHANYKLKPVIFYRGASLVISFFAASMFYKSVTMMF
ncbi:hypothetical protein A8A12_04295 [Serratia marcescens]|nr:hypothetical protein A8A12_04295 [Serratia marcescens]